LAPMNMALKGSLANKLNVHPDPMQ
jgi:hypothetical protein